MTHPQSRLKFWLVTGTLSTVAAIFIHLYLVSLHLNLKYGLSQGDAICSINSTFNCEAVSASRFSEFLGVPLALWGAIGNIVLLLLVAAYFIADPNAKHKARRNVNLVSGAILAASLVMATISVLFLSSYCIFCMVAYLASVLTFIGFAKGLPKAPQDLASAFSIQDLKAPVLFAAVGFLAGFVVDSSMNKSYGGNQVSDIVLQSVGEWTVNPEVKIDTTNIFPLKKGADPSTAKMRIVEFADYGCPHCKFAGPVLDAFVLAHSDVSLEFVPWSLDGECNSAIASSNGVRCLMSRLSACADQSKKGWEANRWLFENQETLSSIEQINKHLGDLSAKTGIPEATLTECALSEATKELVRQQAKLGIDLKVMGTPTIFVNGKHLPRAQFLPVLKAVYEKL